MLYNFQDAARYWWKIADFTYFSFQSITARYVNGQNCQWHFAV